MQSGLVHHRKGRSLVAVRTRGPSCNSSGLGAAFKASHASAAYFCSSRRHTGITTCSEGLPQDSRLRRCWQVQDSAHVILRRLCAYEMQLHVRTVVISCMLNLACCWPSILADRMQDAKLICMPGKLTSTSCEEASPPKILDTSCRKWANSVLADFGAVAQGPSNLCASADLPYCWLACKMQVHVSRP